MFHPHHAALLLLTTSLVACTSRFDAEPAPPVTSTPDQVTEQNNTLTTDDGLAREEVLTKAEASLADEDEASADVLSSKPIEAEQRFVEALMPEPEPMPVPMPEPKSNPMSAIHGASAGLSASGGRAHSRSGPGPSQSRRRIAPVPPPTGFLATPDLSTEENTEEYTDHGVNGFTMTAEDALSTFSIDVDTASYTIARRKLQGGSLPPIAAVRVEEFVNYFDYSYAPPSASSTHPLRVHFDAFPDPFREGRHIMRVGVQAREIPPAERPPLHLTFLVDVSGSMSAQDKLPLAQKSLKMLVASLQEGDTVALATYAGRTAEVLAPTDASNSRRINEAIDGLNSGGSTAMSSGLDLAYNMALRRFEEGAENRVIVVSDGDANVGSVGWEQMLAQIKEKADMGVTMSTVGFGMGNYRDTLMEQLSNKGDGNNYYIDSLQQAQRVFTEEMAGTVFTVARDVKLQVEFHEDSVSAYRLIGYENRDIADRDFRNDRVDAGEIGSEHNVTALYEVILREGYDETLATVRVRYESPGADKAATEAVYPFPDDSLHERVDEADRSSRIAYSAATFAEVLRDSPHVSEMSMEQIIAFAESASRSGESDDQELIQLMRSARELGAGAGVGVAGR